MMLFRFCVDTMRAEIKTGFYQAPDSLSSLTKPRAAAAGGMPARMACIEVNTTALQEL